MIAESNDLSNLKSSKYYLSGVSFKKFKESLSKDDYVLIESCSNAFWLYDEIKDLVKKCYVLNTIKFRSMSNKHDKIDARKLVKKLAFFVMHDADDDDMPTIFIPEKEVRELRSLFTTNKLNKKHICQTKCRIYSILKQSGIQIGKTKMYSPELRLILNGLKLSESEKYQIDLLLDHLEYLTMQENKIKIKIKELGLKLFDEEIKLLLSIKGLAHYYNYRIND